MGMATKGDYYDILGVARDATQEEIRKAYLKLAHKYHPDKTGGDKKAEEKLKEVNEAYDTLKNPDKRSQYDAMCRAQAAGFGGFGPGFDTTFTGGFGGFEAPFDDFFDVLFGRTSRTRRHGVRPGNDLEYRMRITLREAAKGTSKRIRFSRMELCVDCNGTGAARGTQPTTCPECRGSGQIRRAQGFFSISQTCPRCRGTGQAVLSPCTRCGGSGRGQVERELQVDVPPGVDTGQRLRLAGEGEPGEGGGPRGELYVVIEVESDEIFQRDGNDVYCEVPISFAQAALGDTIQVPTLDGGKAELRIPPGTQPGTKFRLAGLGVRDVRGYYTGDEYVVILVEVPTKLTREQRELIAKFQELASAQSYPLHRRFIEKLKRSLGS